MSFKLYKSKLLTAVIFCSALGGAELAFSDQPGEVEIIFDGVVTTASGSLPAVRFSQDATQYIACQVSASEAEQELSMSCEAQDTLGNTFVCHSNESGHVTAALSLSANSVITVDNDHPEADHCGNLTIGTHSQNLTSLAQ